MFKLLSPSNWIINVFFGVFFLVKIMTVILTMAEVIAHQDQNQKMMTQGMKHVKTSLCYH